ncbi:MAG TPA: aspartate 1-decarboxylase [Bacillota bacterium]
MLRMMAKSKLHRVTCTQANLNYVGSITLDRALMDAAGIVPYEMVQITNIANGTWWQTYAIPGDAGSGVVCLNGASARHFHPGDKVIVISYGYYSEAEVKRLVPKIVFVDRKNRITEVASEEIPFTEYLPPDER